MVYDPSPVLCVSDSARVPTTVVQLKRYAECGTQTEMPQVPGSQCTESLSPVESEMTASPMSEAAGSKSLEPKRTVALAPLDFFSPNTAYKGSSVSEYSVPSQSGPSRSSASRQKHKNSPLPYQRPSAYINTSKRTISLPDTLDKIKNTSDSPVRVISLTERPKPPLSSGESASPQCRFETIGSTDISYASADDGHGFRGRVRSYPHSDVPQTPSPPSSPESITIIGNESAVPRSFLRSHAESRHKPSDDGGMNITVPSTRRLQFHFLQDGLLGPAHPLDLFRHFMAPCLCPMLGVPRKQLFCDVVRV